MPKKIKESDLYPIVAKWLKKYHHCFKTATNKGLTYSRIDVIGVRDTGGDLSGEIETIAVEVKKDFHPFASASGQTLGYKVYTNRVYLAEMRKNSFSIDEITIASNLGIGLIHIKNNQCKEILSSPFYKPITKLNLLLIEKLALGKCQLCGCFFNIGNIEKNQWANLSRENLKKAINEGKGLMFWNRELAERKERMHIIKVDASGGTRERRFICPDCVYYFISKIKE